MPEYDIPRKLTGRNSDIDLKEMSDILSQIIDDVVQANAQKVLREKKGSRSLRFGAGDVTKWVATYYNNYKDDPAKVTPVFKKHYDSMRNAIVIGRVLSRYANELFIQRLSKINNRQMYFIQD